MSTTPGGRRGTETVATRMRRLDDSGARFARVLRDTLDQAYDGVHTGRYQWNQLRGAERTHFGAMFAINIQRHFDLPDSTTADFEVGGRGVGVTFDPLPYEWHIPSRLIGSTCLAVCADDGEGTWTAWVLSADHATLEQDPNGWWRPRPRALAMAESIWGERPLPPNVLAQLPPGDVDAILEGGGRPDSGQARVDELFRRVRDRRIWRGTVATVARQLDYMRRVRQNGGSRTNLRPEGIVILGQYDSHRRLADQLGLPVPEDGEFVSSRLVPSGPAGVEIDGARWRRARPGDPVVTAPMLPPG